MLASLACANSMCKMALPTSVYATYTRAVSPLRMKDAAGTPEVPAPVLHMGRLRQPPKRQSHHTNSNHQHNNHNHDILPCRDCDPEHGLGLHPTHTFHGSALAGARLSGVSLINPGAGPAPVSSPEAFGGNRRLYTAAAPAADRLCPIPVHARFTPGPRLYL